MATKILKDHLIKGYTTHEKRLAERGIKELQQSIELLQKTLTRNELVNDIGRETIQLIMSYTKTWQILVLDVTMGEDLSRVRKDHAPENMAMIRHIVLNLLRGAKSQFRKDMSLKGLQKKAGWGENTLSAILMQEF